MKTVYVVGAGASAELNMPTGFALKKTIGELLRFEFDGQKRIGGDGLIADSIVQHAEHNNVDHDLFFHAAAQIANALPLAISIDNFLDAHRNNTYINLVGKLGIARSILAAERECLLFSAGDQGKFDFTPISNTWFISFFQLLVENCTLDDLPARFSQLRFVVFNYDRCVERFLHLALVDYYGISSEKAAEFVGRIEIIHPYGSVGSLEFQIGPNSTPFGMVPTRIQLHQLSSKIRTFTEGSAETEWNGRASIIDYQDVDRVVFLGFAYHHLNMQILFSKEDIDKKTSTADLAVYLGTASGISASDQQVLLERIMALTGVRHQNQIRLSSNECAPFFKENWRRLSFVDSP